MKKHRHIFSSPFQAHGPEGEGWEAMQNPSLARVRIPISRGVNVYVERQVRHLYPSGDGGACCSERRVVLRVYGDVASARDARLVQAAIAHAATLNIPSKVVRGD